ncbi:hypothetical protein PR202_ga28354 [Eleusine coracana subsp. coracana]|uniref:Secreted protein n=1 Tax=Eleusine coracana subsp. coracana TaxID=191504 RepID=A0AAV5DJ77_ELECO|nr:hypothetical protein PR202_ga28354 [Eleusine coracana subsp. coracana]
MPSLTPARLPLKLLTSLLPAAPHSPHSTRSLWPVHPALLREQCRPPPSIHGSLSRAPGLSGGVTGFVPVRARRA